MLPNIPDCCAFCEAVDFWENLEDKCRPELIMTSKMMGKCPEFRPAHCQEDHPEYYKYALGKYKLVTEDENYPL